VVGIDVVKIVDIWCDKLEDKHYIVTPVQIFFRVLLDCEIY